MNLSFVFERKTILNHEMNQNKSSTSIRNLLKEFRNHLRIARTLITKKTTHEAFATLQEKSSNDETTDQKKSEKLLNRKIENRSCLCDRKHSFNECYYLIEKLRSIERKSNEEMMKKIEKILETNSRIRSAVKWVRKNVKRRLKKIIEKEDDSNKSKSSKKKSFNFDEVTLNCFFCRDICEETSLIQIDQLLNVKQRHRHSRLQRFRSISAESNNWLWESANSRTNRLRYWELWDDEYCCQRTRRFDQYSVIERRINVWIFHQSDLSDQDDEKRDSLKHRKSTITSKRDYLLHRWISRKSLSSRE
jgi:hypothetical protein